MNYLWEEKSVELKQKSSGKQDLRQWMENAAGCNVFNTLKYSENIHFNHCFQISSLMDCSNERTSSKDKFTETFSVWPSLND